MDEERRLVTEASDLAGSPRHLPISGPGSQGRQEGEFGLVEVPGLLAVLLRVLDLEPAVDVHRETLEPQGASQITGGLPRW
ncbi:hypothetical protein GCM10020000_53570 [Streptomyces olivoverticillatus]